VDIPLQRFAGRKGRRRPRRNGDHGAGPGIASQARLSLPAIKMPKPPQLHGVATLYGLHNGPTGGNVR
jgi:hypothetical protein